ncbi:GNAT family N-acetyltransferase [Gallaecimonas mangrovi]|uniref:GNAT family N-acetyltransferase n=1 Tax=Gallaecimonas mangrovi TaxID=2291597 RepID=UPI000E1FD5F5|nr:GNAT family N-acetyltransferase [Gallaecimonas mangrovi]
MPLVLSHQLPVAKAYCQLRIAAGLSAKPLALAEKGLANSLYGVCIHDGAQLVAMGRVVGDGSCFFQVVDIAVAPRYQGRGLGKQIMHAIEAYLKMAAQPGSYVSLIADKPGFYEKLGYQHTAPAGYGMYKKFA